MFYLKIKKITYVKNRNIYKFGSFNLKKGEKIEEKELNKCLEGTSIFDRYVLLAVDDACNHSLSAHQPIQLILKKIHPTFKNLKKNKKMAEKCIKVLINKGLVEKKSTSEPSYFLTKLGWIVADELKKQLQ